MAGVIPPQNLLKGTCATCQSCPCLEIPPDKFDALINAVKDKFGALPVDEAATAFVAGWVSGHYPKDAPTALSLAFMSRYINFAQDMLCEL